MLIRISLIIAIIAGLAVGVVNFVQVKTVIETTRNERDYNKTEWDKETSAHGKTKKELKSTQDELAVTKDTLKTTEEARDSALADAEKNRKFAAEQTAKLKATTQERDEAQAELAAWKVLGIPVEQVKTVIAQLKQTQDALDVSKQENKILAGKVSKLQNELDYYRDPNYQVQLPAGLKATVMVSDPKWDFVVLNVGENEGVLERGELLVNRNGKLVAKVRVIRVEADRCIANVVSGWKLTDVVEGDLAIPAF
jgi:chromosome segregation ATPase